MQNDVSPSPALLVPGRSPTVTDNRRVARRMLWRAALAQNVMTGFVFGAFGTFVMGIEADYHVDRATSTLPIPLVLLALAVLAPIIGARLQRWSLRTIMLSGAVLMSLGFAGIAWAGSMLQLMLVFGLLIGPGAALLGGMIPIALVTRWYQAGLGRALGMVNVPLFTGLAPLFSVWLQEHMSYRGVALVMAAVTFGLVPVLWGVISDPAQRGLQPVGAEDKAGAPRSAPLPALPYRKLLRSPALWATALIGVILAEASSTMVTHLLPMAVSWGHAPERAAWLLSALGLIGVIGSPLFGWVADRLGPPAALTLNVVVQASCWFALLGRPVFGLMLPLCLTLGLATSSMLSVFGAALSQRFGAVNFGRCYGVFSLINLPFVVSTPVIFGKVFTATGSYGPALVGQLVAFGVALCAGLWLLLSARGQAQPGHA
jgi:MFS family permease